MSDKFKNIKTTATVKGLARTMPTIQVDATGIKSVNDIYAKQAREAARQAKQHFQQIGGSAGQSYERQLGDKARFLDETANLPRFSSLSEQLDQRAKIGRDSSRVRPMQVSQQQWAQYPDPADQKLQRRIQALRQMIRDKQMVSGGDQGLNPSQFSLSR